MDTLVFWFFAVVSVLMAIGVVFAPSVLYAALCLLSVFFCMAGFFLLNNADFLAVAQVMVYAVGLTIVLMFGLMFTGNQALPAQDNKWGWLVKTIAVFSGLSIAGVLAKASSSFVPKFVTPMAEPMKQNVIANGTATQLGELLLTKYILPFELVSVLLLIAMIGAILLSKKTFSDQGSGVFFSFDEGKLVPEALGWKKDVGLE
ncbi:MAG: NADH-quinone oxidoreductase subunit J [Vampirovibrio sp.]|nr:NADH-quinone oxidoreductase subunit J [Vampirovibrio sp.]